MKINDRTTTQDTFKFIILDESALIAMTKKRLCNPDNFVMSVPGNNVCWNRCFSWMKDSYRNMTDEEVRAFINEPDRRHMIAAMIKEMSGDKQFGAKISEYHNLVPSVLRNALASVISGTAVTPTFEAQYFALGTGSAAASNADLTLGTETLRAAFTDRSFYTNIAYLDVFFPTASVGGNTYTEAGIFVDGTASANTGYLLSRVVINQTLGASQTLTVNASITIS